MTVNDATLSSTILEGGLSQEKILQKSSGLCMHVRKSTNLPLLRRRHAGAETVNQPHLAGSNPPLPPALISCLMR